MMSFAIFGWVLVIVLALNVLLNVLCFIHHGLCRVPVAWQPAPPWFLGCAISSATTLAWILIALVRL